MHIPGVHVARGMMPPGAIGRRAVAVNLSDLAAMGATPEKAWSVNNTWRVSMPHAWKFLSVFSPNTSWPSLATMATSPPSLAVVAPSLRLSATAMLPPEAP